MCRIPDPVFEGGAGDESGDFYGFRIDQHFVLVASGAHPALFEGGECDAGARAFARGKHRGRADVDSAGDQGGPETAFCGDEFGQLPDVELNSADPSPMSEAPPADGRNPAYSQVSIAAAQT